MSSCEKCWIDQQVMGIPYAEMVKIRQDHPCTPEQQAGPCADVCPVCKRMTLHQYTNEPMCGCPAQP
jgi:hypothetical protein